MTIRHLSPHLLLQYFVQHRLDIPKDYYAPLVVTLNYVFNTFITTLVQIMKLLIYFTLLELPDNIHIFLTDGVIFEVIEFCGIVGEIKKINASFMFIIEFSDVLFNIKIMAALSMFYFPYLTILSVNYFLD